MSDLETLAAMLLDEEIREQNAARERQYERAAQHRERAALIERMMGAVREHQEKGLHSDENDRSVSVAMDQAHLLRRDRPGQPLKSRHPFPRALDKRGIAVEAWARDHNINAVTVRAWYGKGEAGRRIPRAIAETIERELGVPATQEVWKNGIR